MKKILSEIHRQYEDIMHSGMATLECDRTLADLMAKMEHKYGIPALHDPE